MIQTEEYQYTDPVTQFLKELYVDFDFEAAQVRVFSFLFSFCVLFLVSRKTEKTQQADKSFIEHAQRSGPSRRQ